MGKRKEKDGEKEEFRGTNQVRKVDLQLSRRAAEDIQFKKEILRTLVVVDVEDDYLYGRRQIAVYGGVLVEVPQIAVPCLSAQNLA